MPDALSPTGWDHLKACQDCVSALWICHASSSFEEVKRKLKGYGLSED
jgi:hypothetical protein